MCQGGAAVVSLWYESPLRHFAAPCQGLAGKRKGRFFTRSLPEDLTGDEFGHRVDDHQGLTVLLRGQVDLQCSSVTRTFGRIFCTRERRARTGAGF
jgi:hypothetical protein